MIGFSGDLFFGFSNESFFWVRLRGLVVGFGIFVLVL